MIFSMYLNINKHKRNFFHEYEEEKHITKKMYNEQIHINM